MPPAGLGRASKDRRIDMSIPASDRLCQKTSANHETRSSIAKTLTAVRKDGNIIK
jgi:hypothetical protein